jgi:hypothetical protein
MQHVQEIPGSQLDWQPMASHAGFVNDNSVIVAEDTSMPKSRSPRMNKCTNPPRCLTRAESFLGFHFDFHATTDNEPIGGRSFQSDLARMLREAKPDYVQCDCKGHPGVSSYPTKAGNPRRNPADSRCASAHPLGSKAKRSHPSASGNENPLYLDQRRLHPSNSQN